MSRNELERVAAAVIVLMYREKRRKVWVRSWLSKRSKRVAFENLIQEIQEDAMGFQNFCRLSVRDLEHLLSLVGPHISKQETRLRVPISAKERLLVTLRFLATGDSYRSLMHLFRISDSAISKIVPEVCGAIAALKNQFIKLPASANEWERIAGEFNQEWNFPHCIGALDGKHIVMRAPPNSGSYYYNYKHTHSVVLMVLADAKYRIIYADIGANKGVSDGEVFENCSLYGMLNNKTLVLPKPCPLPGRKNDSPFVIVAEEAFTLSENIVKPFPYLNQPDSNKIFNCRLLRTLRIVENVFGHIAQRFRVLRRPLLIGPAVTDQVVTAICVLHNFLTEYNENYASSQAYDREDHVKHCIIEGDWRKEKEVADTYFPLQRDLCNSTDRVGEVREEFRDYFLSSEGELAWQYQFT